MGAGCPACRAGCEPWLSEVAPGLYGSELPQATTPWSSSSPEGLGTDGASSDPESAAVADEAVGAAFASAASMTSPAARVSIRRLN